MTDVSDNRGGASIREAYAAIRSWYQQNTDKPIDNGDAYRLASAPLVRALPVVSALSDVEIVAVFREVIAGRLEWAYGAEGGAKIVARARAALEAAGRSYTLTPEEEAQLGASVLWPFIKR
jgi:hypothetical protein